MPKPLTLLDIENAEATMGYISEKVIIDRELFTQLAEIAKKHLKLRLDN